MKTRRERRRGEVSEASEKKLSPRPLLVVNVVCGAAADVARSYTSIFSDLPMMPLVYTALTWNTHENAAFQSHLFFFNWPSYPRVSNPIFLDIPESAFHCSFSSETKNKVDGLLVVTSVHPPPACWTVVSKKALGMSAPSVKGCREATVLITHFCPLLFHPASREITTADVLTNKQQKEQ